MARRVIEKVQLAAVIAFLLDGVEDVRGARAAQRAAEHASRQVNEFALTRALGEREEMLSRTIEALRIASADGILSTSSRRRNES